MRSTVYHSESPAFTWVDVVAPTTAELEALAAEYHFHPMAVEDCLDPWHLPKYEKFTDTTFLLLRAYDLEAGTRGSSVQELTRKIAVFSRPDLVVTIHRAELPLIAALRERYAVAGGDEDRTTLGLIVALINAALDSYGGPLEKAEALLDGFEEDLFSPRRRAPELLTIHVLKRQVTLIKRLIWQTNVVIQRAIPGDKGAPAMQDVKESGDAYYFYADELLDEINNLLSIHVSLASHRTNEGMRVLTVFSAFFLPLTFIVGVYGMNFTFMPELHHRLGYPAVLLLMVIVCAGIAIWFKKRGWLGRGGA